MVLESRFAPYPSRKSLSLIFVLACLVLPLFVQSTSSEARAVSNDEPLAPSTQKTENSATSEFPYAVKFEQGATRFNDGDKITVDEVRGTADTFAPGNIYCIKGTYTLASHSRAKLSASITAMDAEHGRSTPLKVQATLVNKGDGTFTLFLPMAHRGWPHVSFYPADRGSDFGGNYFGTGDCVLKRWWGSRTADNKTASSAAGSKDEAPAPTVAKPEKPPTSEFPSMVNFEQGATRFLNGDKVTIVEIRGTADRFAPGNTYQIKGTYTLGSHNRAMLAAYVTSSDPDNGKGSSPAAQTTVVDQGDGRFTLILPMTCQGWPHVSFYPADGGSDFGGNYFGTGDSVLKRWWGSKE